jgi:signal transduction histidine kinase
MGGAGSVGARAENAWLRSYPFWDTYYAMVLVATIVLMVLDGGPPAAIGLVLVLALAYVVIGRKAVRAPRVPVPEAWWYAAAMLILITATEALESASELALSALVPMAFMSLRAGPAVAVTMGLLAGPAVTELIANGTDPLITLLAAAVVLSASTLLGTFIGRLAAQNRERARLIEELDRTRDELAEVSKEAGVLAERERLAGDIHDTLAQGFTGIVLLLQAAQAGDDRDRYIGLAVRTAKENLAETRALIAALAPPALAGASLSEAMARLAGGFELPVEVSVTGAAVPLPAATEVVLVRVAQEGLANVRKHAAAGRARLALDYDGDRLRLSVGDDGRGFTPSDPTTGYGLRAMRGRVEQLGGTVTVDSAPGRGATLTVEVPCSAC